MREKERVQTTAQVFAILFCVNKYTHTHTHTCSKSKLVKIGDEARTKKGKMVRNSLYDVRDCPVGRLFSFSFLYKYLCFEHFLSPRIFFRSIPFALWLVFSFVRLCFRCFFFICYDCSPASVFNSITHLNEFLLVCRIYMWCLCKSWASEEWFGAFESTHFVWAEPWNGVPCVWCIRRAMCVCVCFSSLFISPLRQLDSDFLLRRAETRVRAGVCFCSCLIFHVQRIQLAPFMKS